MVPVFLEFYMEVFEMTAKIGLHSGRKETRFIDNICACMIGPFRLHYGAGFEGLTANAVT